MNMTGFVHPHQKKRYDEADSGPLETPDGQFKHFGLNSTARTAALNYRLPRFPRGSGGIGCRAAWLTRPEASPPPDGLAAASLANGRGEQAGSLLAKSGW
jgi:hypothetical protein